ncbi:hypothetical protein WJX77_000727 [Trebouxia sp. C0004]
MSLYKAREWWSTSCGHEEEYETRSLVIGSTDSSSSEQGNIITGSLQGVLRVYQPHGQGFSIEDLLLEVQLSAPILQLELGTFTSLGGHQLAVLHPRKLVVYNLSSLASSQGTAGLQLNKLSEHVLDRSAANMVCGNFGGSKGALQICVQSMDGQLSFYERETLAFSRFLPQFLLPGPLCYSQALDCIITCSSAYEVECYKYQTVAAAQAAATKTTGPDTNSKGGKQLHTEWKWVFGEMAWDIQISRFTGSEESDIVLLGEHTLVVLNSQGQLCLQKRFDYQPVAFTMYNVSGNRNNLLVAAATGQMMVYCHKRLVWAAKGDTCPVAVRVATFAGLQGLVLTLDDAGKLVLSYMGTDPPMQSVDVRHSAEVDFAALDSEYREVAGRIQALGAPTEAVVPLQQLLITAQVPSLLDRSEDLPQDMLSGSAFSAVTVHLYLRHSGAASLTDVTLSLDALPGLHLDQDCITVPHVSSTDSSAVIVRLQARGSGVPSDNTLKAVATYASSSGEPRTTSTKVTLPLSLFCQLVAPQQAAVFKVTLDTNRPPPQLADLFQDMVAQAQMDLQQHGQYANVMSFKYTRGPVVTILVSKSAGRYRIQSDSFGAMWLIVQELCQRLRNFFSTAESSEQEHAGSQEDFAITSKEAVPLEELWASIEKHCQARQAVAASQAALSDRAQQQRAVQKRLLMCFKDRQPGSLAHLELLLAETFDQLVDLGSQQEQQQVEVETAGSQLAATVQLILQLVRYSFGMSLEDVSVLTAHFSPQVSNGGSIGWEELTEAGMTHLLANQLARNQHERSVQTTPLAQACDVHKLKKHISIVLERLSKGASLSAPPG